jgi:hypothetical protein
MNVEECEGFSLAIHLASQVKQLTHKTLLRNIPRKLGSVTATHKLTPDNIKGFKQGVECIQELIKAISIGSMPDPDDDDERYPLEFHQRNYEAYMERLDK